MYSGERENFPRTRAATWAIALSALPPVLYTSTRVLKFTADLKVENGGRGRARGWEIFIGCKFPGLFPRYTWKITITVCHGGRWCIMKMRPGARLLKERKNILFVIKSIRDSVCAQFRWTRALTRPTRTIGTRSGRTMKRFICYKFELDQWFAIFLTRDYVSPQKVGEISPRNPFGIMRNKLFEKILCRKKPNAKVNAL